MKEFDLKQYLKNSYNVKVPDYWERIQNANTSNIPQIIENQKSRMFIFSRSATAVICLTLIIVASIIGIPYLLDGSSNQSYKTYGQDTPVRIGQLGSMKTEFGKKYTFEEAYVEADLVAEIVITEWLGELDNDEYDQLTYFRAKIIKEFKNRLNLQNSEILIVQQGNSKWTYNGYPLFKSGDRFLLSLFWIDPINHPKYCIEGEDCFAIVGSQLTEMQIVERDSKQFALKRNIYQNFTDIESFMLPDSADIILDTLEQDEILIQAGTVFECVYSMDNLENYMDNLKKRDRNE